MKPSYKKEAKLTVAGHLCLPFLFWIRKYVTFPLLGKGVGYIFDLSMIRLQADTKGQSQDLMATRLHAILKVVLSTFVEAQKEGAQNDICLPLGKHTKRVNLKPVCFLL